MLNSTSRIHAQYLSASHPIQETQLVTSVVLERNGVPSSCPPSHRLIPPIQETAETAGEVAGTRGKKLKNGDSLVLPAGDSLGPEVTLTLPEDGGEKTVTWRLGTGPLSTDCQLSRSCELAPVTVTVSSNNMKTTMSDTCVKMHPF